MKLRPLPGNSQLQFSQIIYGVFRLTDDSDTSAQNIRRKVDAALNEGITTFDHADIYGNYQCEALFGQVLQRDPSLRQQIQIISKCDIAMRSDKYPKRRVKYYDTSASYIRTSVEQSLINLHTDRLDTLLLHRPDPLMDAAETANVLDELVDTGKVLSVGVSNFQPEDWRLLQSKMKHPLVLNQIELSLTHRDSFTNGDLSALQRDGMLPMAWSPLGGGALFSDTEAVQRLKPLLKEMADRHSCRIDVIALAWLLRHPAGILPVIGTTRLERINGIAQALEIEMDRESWFELWTAASGQEVP